MSREWWRWLLVLGLCVGLVGGAGLWNHVVNVLPERGRQARVEAEIDRMVEEARDPAKEARDKAIVACRAEGLGGGTTDEQVERRMVCLARHGYHRG
jgi:hypothetical protein